ncbi:MAG TPA: efflux RND transporter periplasmic adaptor subunit, partial [Phycisphaerales bacterium]|nr:efflux RND transporter periplasmic adaptor subunit [Phycisphaerales bacterium]
MARYIPALLALFLLSGCSLFSKSGGKGGYGLPPVPISLLTLEDTSLAEEISLLGEGRSRSDSSLNSLTTGVVSQLLVDVGDEVTAGQAVAYLDGTDQRIALAEAE